MSYVALLLGKHAVRVEVQTWVGGTSNVSRFLLEGEVVRSDAAVLVGKKTRFSVDVGNDATVKQTDAGVIEVEVVSIKTRSGKEFFMAKAVLA